VFKQPDKDDWGKLRRVLIYLKGTKRLKQSLSAETLSVLKWWIDASHAVHKDCKSHTGMGMTFGKGMPLTASKKQKLNGKSSTESELIAVDDVLPQVLWTHYFLEAQGYKIKKNVVFQDNKSAILLEMNGIGSSSKRTKHIKVHYFFMKDKVDSKEISVKYCPTEEMWADVMTKPWQGKGFKEFRAVVMNCPVEYSDREDLELETEYEMRLKRNSKETSPGNQEDRPLKDPKPTEPSPQECVEEPRTRDRLGTSRKGSQPLCTLSQSARRWCHQTFEALRTDGWSRRAARAAASV